MEEIGEGKMAVVNGKEILGPITVVRKWSLHGVAIVPHGADSETSTYLQGQDNKEKEVVIMEQEAENTSAEATQQEAVEVQAEAVEVKENSEAEAAADEVQDVEQVKPCADCCLTRDDFLKYCQLYGEQNATVFFREGLTFEQAASAYVETLKAENARLRKQVEGNAAWQQSSPGFSPQRVKENQSVVSDDFYEQTARKYGVSVEVLKKSQKK
jgi:hypothetical protein